MKVQFNEEMACGVFQHSRDLSAKQGRWVDAKLDPERIGELPEAKDWPALGGFLAGINATNLFRTTGCNSRHDPVAGGHEAPFIDIALDDPRLRQSSEACAQLREKLLSLDGNPAADGLALELVQSEATMPDGEVVPSTRIWILGTREQAEAAFPHILTALKSEMVPDYLARCREELQPSSGSVDGLFAATVVQLTVDGVEDALDGTYLCDSRDGYRTWQITANGADIRVDLGNDPYTPKWNLYVRFAGNEAHYEGEDLKLPLYRGEVTVRKVAGTAEWPDQLKFDVY